MKGSRCWWDLWHEGRLGFGWWHAAVVAAALILGWPGVGESIGLADRSLLITGRAGLPMVTMTFAAGLALRDVARGTWELVSASRRGLEQVWLVRLVLWLAWAAVVTLVFLVPVEARAHLRHGPVLEVGATLLDVVVFGCIAASAANDAGSESAGILAALAVWVGGILIAINPPGPAWLGYATPVSAYFRGSDALLLLNRVAWGTVAAVLVFRQLRRLRYPGEMRFGVE